MEKQSIKTNQGETSTLTSFFSLINYCEKIKEYGWADDLRNINSKNTIEDFNDLECHLIDNNMVDHHSELKRIIWNGE
jgi:hypothetical protein